MYAARHDWVGVVADGDNNDDVEFPGKPVQNLGPSELASASIDVISIAGREIEDAASLFLVEMANGLFNEGFRSPVFRKDRQSVIQRIAPQYLCAGDEDSRIPDTGLDASSNVPVDGEASNLGAMTVQIGNRAIVC